MKLSDKKIVERQVNRIYRSSVALDESVIYDCACVGVSLIEKSNYSWESESNYKLAQRLMDCRYNEQITNGNVRDFLYLFGLLFYLSFKQEREGYANGLYAYLKNCGRKLDKNTIHRLAKNDETHTILKYLMILNDCLSGVTNDNDIDDAIVYLNSMSDGNKKQYTKEKITKMCSEILRDMQKRINNAKYHALGLNETMLYPLNVFEHNNFLNWKK